MKCMFRKIVLRKQSIFCLMNLVSNEQYGLERSKLKVMIENQRLQSKLFNCVLSLFTSWFHIFMPNICLKHVKLNIIFIVKLDGLKHLLCL